MDTLGDIWGLLLQSHQHIAGLEVKALKSKQKDSRPEWGVLRQREAASSWGMAGHLTGPGGWSLTNCHQSGPRAEALDGED